MRKPFLTICCGILLSLVSPVPSFAQENSQLESCFVYYNYGKVKTHLGSDKQMYKDSETIKIAGTIENQNTFPLVDVALYAHLKRLNTPEKFEAEGHFLVDRMIILDHLSFGAGESKWIQAPLPLKASYPKGSYQLQYFIFSPNGFHYSGRPFLEEDTAGYSNFDIDTKVLPSIYFDLSSLTVNGSVQSIRGAVKEFPKEPLILNIKLASENSQELAIPGHIALYSFDDADENNKIVSEDVLIKPRDKGILSYTFTPEKAGAYVFVATVDAPVATDFKYRFAVTGAGEPDVRLNDLNITDFPVVSSSRAYLCFHSPAPIASRETEITLTVLNSENEVVEESSILGSFDGGVQAISIPIGSIPDTKNLKVQATFTDKTTGQVVKTAEVSYSCDTFVNSIQDIQLSYDETKPDRVLISSSGICNQAIEKGFIEQIKIFKDGKVVKEEYNKPAQTLQYSLSGLDKGVYMLEVKSGRINQQLPINLKKSLVASKQAPKVRMIGYMIGVILTGAILVVIVLLKRGKRIV